MCPDVEISWVRDSTGVITSRFLAEKENPRADIVLGLAATSLLLFEKMNLLEEYKPAGADALKPAYRDTSGPYTWTGMDAFLAVVCFNTAEAAKEKVSAPTSWMDLTKPEFKGKIVMPHPASSGTGYLKVAAWLQIMGEQAGWAFMDKLHENIAVYTHSGSAPLRAGCQGRAHGGHRLRHARRAREDARRADRPHPAEGRRWLGHGSDRHREGHQEPRRREEGGGLGGHEEGERALWPLLRPRGASRCEERPAELPG
jgi:iron(III) transport system substrate-binding protein